MTGILYAEVNLICVLIMLILVINVYKSDEDLVEKRVFLALTISCCIMFISDAVWSLSNSGVLPKTYEIIYWSNFCYYLVSGLTGYTWFLFAECLYSGPSNNKKQLVGRIIAGIPVVLIIILTITNPLTKAVYYLDSDLTYHRGNMHFIQATLGYGYEGYVIIKGIARLFAARDEKLKKRFATMLVFLMLPILSSIGQVFFGEIPALCVGTTLAELLVYIYIVSREKELLLIDKSKQERSILEQALASTLYSYSGIYYIQFRSRTFKMVYPNYEEDTNSHSYSLLREKIISSLSAEDKERGETEQFLDLNRARMELMKNDSIQHKYSIITENFTEEWENATFIVRDKEGIMPVSAFLTIRNIQEILSKEQSRKKELEEALSMAEAANTAKSTFLNNMSHDIRTPMNAILGFTEMAHKDMDDREKVKDCLDKIELSGRHLLNLINDVLDMSSIESGKLKFTHVVVDISEQFDLIHSMFQSEADNKNITFTVDYSEVDNMFIYADELRARQVGVNIVSNAFKYTPNGGKIDFIMKELPCQKPGYANYEFTVQDDGIGMSEEFQNHLFDQFSRERSSTLSGVQGTGLGMAIVKKIVDVCNGQISVSSKIGEGTKITILLEFKVAPRKEKKENEKSDISVSFKGKRILLVEDNELNREIASAILGELGVEVETAEDGSRAVSRMGEVAPGYYDMIFMDLQMPVMDGYTATKLIRQMDDPQICSVPIVAMTANAFDEDKAKTKHVGMNGHVSKPIDVDEMIKTMKNCMGL